jgi:hypothetical protein
MKFKHTIFMVLIGALLFSVAPVHARMFGNTSESAYEDGDGASSTGEATLACSYTIEELIIMGAKYYFKAHADINWLSEKVEISDIYGAWQAVNSALANMETARYYYRELQYKANRTPYNQVVINKILEFDYNSFQEEHGLLKDVFSEVKSYLVVGDVRGIYRRTSEYFDNLINLLETIKGEVYWWKIPANKNMWNLNQVCAKTHMFGQYVARVFEEIK